MPKSKPDQTVAFRIELQEKERELLEAWVAGNVIKNAVVPAAVAAGVGSAAYIGYKSAKAAFGWAEDIIDDIKGTPLGAYAQSVDASGGATLPNPGLRGLYRVANWLVGRS
ncbi:MAG: hypothetical protein VYA57_04820 [Candidatus Thermoplasmatota archaeon]|nr:hypothetical protein [Candidatus Thermoplasmatota archaeon]